MFSWVCISHTEGWLLDAKNLPESDPELPGHDAVEDEVDHAVGEDQHVHQLPQGGVAVDKELIT